MDRDHFSKMNEDELKQRESEQKRSRLMHAALIGFLAGILLFGLIAFILSPDKKFGFFIPMLIPLFFLYKLFKKPQG